jgi:DNA repair protein RadC
VFYFQLHEIEKRIISGLEFENRKNKTRGFARMTEKPHYLQHRKRLRERFQKSGSEGMHDYELLELLLTYAVPRRDVKPVAKKLVDRFGGISGVLDAGQKDLEQVFGVGSISATLIRLVKELCTSYLSERMKKRDALSSPKLVADFARLKLSGLPHEAFMVVYLNVKNEILDHKVLIEGTVDSVAIYPRKIIEAALSNHATGLILVHNHPSGHPEPSEEDKKITRDIIEAARTLDIRVLDHIVVGKDGYFSFLENRLLTG